MQDSYMQSVKINAGVKLDPRTKMIVLLAINIPAFTANEWYVLALSALIPLSLLFFRKGYLITCVYAILYTLALLADAFLVDTTTGALNIIITLISGVLCRMMPGIIMGYVLLTTTTVSEFVASMERMHVSKQIIIPCSVMFRFLPTIKEESSAITDAMKMRGISLGKTKGNIITLMEYRLVPFMISCVKIGDELSSAALTRGLGSEIKRTNICKIGFFMADYIYLLFAVIIIIFYIANGGGF